MVYMISGYLAPTPVLTAVVSQPIWHGQTNRPLSNPGSALTAGHRPNSPGSVLRRAPNSVRHTFLWKPCFTNHAKVFAHDKYAAMKLFMKPWMSTLVLMWAPILGMLGNGRFAWDQAGIHAITFFFHPCFHSGIVTLFWWVLRWHVHYVGHVYRETIRVTVNPINPRIAVHITVNCIINSPISLQVIYFQQKIAIIVSTITHIFPDVTQHHNN